MLFKTATLMASRASSSGLLAVRPVAVFTTPFLRGMATSASAPPPSIPPPASHTNEPSDFDPTKEEMRLHYRSYNESEYKLGKHRSNALELIEQVPVIKVDGEMAICDGGGGALGHPLEYISLQRPGVIERCKYCGLRFASNDWDDDHHH